LEPALPLQTQCLETTPLPPILQRAFRGFHAYLMPISKIKLHCATISNSDVAADVDIYDGAPGVSGSRIVIGKDASGAASYTWTTGDSTHPLPRQVYAVGLAETAYDQITLTLSVALPIETLGVFSSPLPPTPPATHPIAATQPATVEASGYLVAFDGTGDDENANDKIHQFSQQYDPGKLGRVNYYPGVASVQRDPNWYWRESPKAYGDWEAQDDVRKALDSLRGYYSSLDHYHVPLDVIGYSRGAMEAVKFLSVALAPGGIEIPGSAKTTAGRKLFMKISNVRFVGLIAPCIGIKGDRLVYDFPKAVPPGILGMYQALAGQWVATHNIVLDQNTITKPDNPPPDTKTYKNYGHTNIQKQQDVLDDMEADAKKVGVRFK
ncbi:MAG TPA: hypothetical protein VFC78_12225, partial [Tepidisphaeraceae bacterium]|nr:hypothetical protein [Tepidisphaeraceae bacterium]